MARALFILGHAGSGKTQIAKKWIKERIKLGEAWCLMDKDTTGQVLSAALMKSLGLDPMDKDSVEYKNNVRDLEYEACLAIAREQLYMGVNVVLPGPWNKEIISGKVFNNVDLNFPEKTQTRHIYLDVPEDIIKDRIFARNSRRDDWKLEHWDEYKTRLVKPEEIKNRNIVTIYHDTPDFIVMKKIKHMFKIEE
jgi:predicted kinase